MQGFICANFYIGILLVSIEASVPLQRVQQEIFHEPVPETFDTSEILPEYEAVPIDQLYISERGVDQSSQNISLHNKSIEDIRNWIQPPDWALFTEDTPVYGLRNTSNGTEYFLYENAMKIYGSNINMKYFYNYQNDRKKRQIDDVELKHLVKPVSIENRVDDITGRNNESEGSSRTKRPYGDIIYPEILVIVDYDTFELHGKNVHNLLMYLNGFWNGVDLRFRSLESPKVRLNIAAILIDESNIGLSYISSNNLNSGYLDIIMAMNDSFSWLYDNLNGVIDRNEYDVAVTMTSLRFYDSTADPGPSQLGLVGMSIVGSACHVNDDEGVMLRTAMIHDRGAFNGIPVTAHELGHAFGAEHDNEPLSSQCESIDGYIMYSKVSERVYAGGWSQCSQNAMKEFIKTNGSCLYNEPKLSHKFNTYLPGKMKNVSEQCEILEETKPFICNANICQKLCCVENHTNNTKYMPYGPPPPGTRCGHKKICLNFECVMEPETDLAPKPHVVQLN